MPHLVKPELDYLPQYKTALEKGWSPDNLRLLEAAHEEPEKIAHDPQAFVDGLDEVSGNDGDFSMPPEAKVILPDGSNAPRLPGFRRCMWDETDGARFAAASAFAGSRARRRFHRTCWGISAMLLCHGSRIAGMQRQCCRNYCRT